MDYVIIVAGGKGLRMGGSVPKQFQLLADRPIIMHTIEKFVEALPQIKVVLVLNAEYKALWFELCKKYGFHRQCTIVAGGQERFYSVKNGLETITNGDIDSVVGIHDAVRPLVSVDVIRNAYTKARECRAVVPVIPALDSVRLITSTTSQAIDRSIVRLVQTPQVFSLPLLRKAYEQPYSESFTDDASVVEAMGYSIKLIPGNRENIKLTTPLDKIIASTFIKGSSY